MSTTTDTMLKNTLDETSPLNSVIRDVPAWFAHHSMPEVYDVRSVADCGCAAGAWMDAVYYEMAIKTMSDHGDDVMDYIAEHNPDALTAIDLKDASWGGLASALLSTAIDTWCAINVERVNNSLEWAQECAHETHGNETACK